MNKTIIATAIVLCGAISCYACGTDGSPQEQQELSLTQESAASAEMEHTTSATAQTESKSTTVEPTKEPPQGHPEKTKKDANDSTTAIENTPSKSDEMEAVEIDEGRTLVSAADCFACHKKEERLVGPSYMEVAKKYAVSEQNIEQLANKIKEGGAGVWGAVPMSPHPSLSKSDARKMVAYILSLKP